MDRGYSFFRKHPKTETILRAGRIFISTDFSDLHRLNENPINLRNLWTTIFKDLIRLKYIIPAIAVEELQMNARIEAQMIPEGNSAKGTVLDQQGSFSTSTLTNPMGGSTVFYNILPISMLSLTIH